MADPFSLAAGALSILSVAIQVIEGLSKFYTSFKYQDRQIKQLVTRLEQTSGTLCSLKHTIDQRVFRDDEANILRKIESSLFDSHELVRDLSQECQKLSAQSSPDKIMGAIRLAGRRISYPFRESTLQKLDEDIRALDENLILATNILQLKDSRHLQEELQSIKELTEAMRLSQISNEFRQWLQPCDVLVDQVAATSKRYERTGSWFTDGDTFRNWLHSVGTTSFIWISGFAGCGKSVLCSSAIQSAYVYKQSLGSEISTAICFFYFTFSDKRKQDAMALLTTIISQLSAQSSSVQDMLRTYREAHEAEITTLAVLLELFHRSILLLDHVYIFMDAVDEVPAGRQRREVLKTICHIQGWSCSSVHLFITSRDETDIRDSVGSLPVDEVPMKNDAIDQDIDDYISKSLSTDTQLRKLEAHHDKIQKTLKNKAQGVFRWVDCQLESIKRCPRSAKRLDECLNNLPPDLDLSYERILCDIREESFQDALRLLKLLCFSARPLTVLEVIDALAVDLNEPASLDLSLRFSDADSICEICASLVRIEQPDPNHRWEREPTVRIAHFSVQEYLMCDRMRLQRAHRFSLIAEDVHAELALLCVTYLLDPRVVQTPRPGGGHRFACDPFPLTIYAGSQWEEHYQHVTNAKHSVHDAVRRLFLSHLESLHLWIQLRDRSSRKLEVGYHKYPSSDSLSASEPLWFASLLGFSMIVNKLLDQGDDVNADAGYDHTNPLTVASRVGKVSIVQQLLDHGANPNLRSRTGRTALLYACAFGHVQVVRTLISAGADVHQCSVAPEGLRDGLAVDEYTPLQMASFQGFESIARTLIQAGADVNICGTQGCTALYAACCSGHISVVGLLIDNGADVGGLGWGQETPLFVASLEGSTDVVRLLLQNGVDVNAKCGAHLEYVPSTDREDESMSTPTRNRRGVFSETALHAATEGRCVETAQLLLDHGADVNAENNLGHTPLRLAMGDDWSDAFVDLLLSRGANVRKLDIGDCWSIAHFGGEDQLIRFIKLGILVDHPRDGPSVFHHVELFLECTNLMWAVIKTHPDYEIPAELYPEALVLASKSGNQDLMKALVTRGSDRSAWKRELGLALQTAAWKGDLEAVRLFVECGADIDLVTLSYGTALQIAASRGSREMIEILWDAGADVNMQSVYGSALYLAAEQGHLDIVRLLIAHGADVHHGAREYGLETVRQFYKEQTPILKYNIGDFEKIFNPLLRDDVEYSETTRLLGESIFRAILAEDYFHIFRRPEYFEAAHRGDIIDRANLITGQASILRGTTMQVAAAHGHLEIVRLLIQQGADVNAAPGSAGTVLEAAAVLGDVDLIQLLIENGAHVTAADGEQPICVLSLARENNHHAAVEILLRHEASKAIERPVGSGENMPPVEGQGNPATLTTGGVMT